MAITSVRPSNAPKSTAPLAPRYAGHPVLGNLLQRSRDPLGLCLDSQRQLGDVVRFRMAHIHVEQLTHPDHLQHVLVDAKARYGKGVIWDKTRPLVGDGLLTSEGEQWRRRHRAGRSRDHGHRPGLGVPPPRSSPRLLDRPRALRP